MSAVPQVATGGKIFKPLSIYIVKRVSFSLSLKANNNPSLAAAPLQVF